MTRTFLAIALTTITISANAAGLGDAASYNAFFFSSVNTGGGHADGAVAVAGNWNGSYYEINQHNLDATTPVGSTSLTLGGNNNVSNYLRTMNGNSHVTGSYGNLDLQGNQKDHAVPATFFSDQQSYSQNQSTNLRNAAVLSGHAIDTSPMNNIHVNLGSYAGHTQYWTVSGSDLVGNKSLDFNGWNGVDTIVIDVAGEVNNYTWQANMNGGLKNKVIWNFKDASVLNVNREFNGSILATSATINQYQNIQGNIIANGWNQYNGSEIHFGDQHQFTGDIPGGQAVPEPMTFAVLGLGALGMLRRRKK